MKVDMKKALSRTVMIINKTEDEDVYTYTVVDGAQYISYVRIKGTDGIVMSSDEKQAHIPYDEGLHVSTEDYIVDVTNKGYNDGATGTFTTVKAEANGEVLYLYDFLKGNEYFKVADVQEHYNRGLAVPTDPQGKKYPLRFANVIFVKGSGNSYR